MTGRPPWLAAIPVPADSARTADGPSEETRALVLARAEDRCESCGTSLLGKPYSLHHRRPRGMGGTRAADAHSPVNLVALCGRGNHDGCHGLVHQHPAAALAGGLLVRRSADPARVRLVLHDGRAVLLTPAATYVEETGD